ncbi:hypothetical protein CYLTODRAFT_379540, partial [Cylindrobasidium torrendii FP15055 ss-10]
MITPEDASLIGSFAQSVLYGIYLAVAFRCTRILRRRHQERKTRPFLVITHILLFLTINTRCIVVMTRAIMQRWHRSVGAAATDYASALSLAANIPWMLTIAIYDIFLIYRILMLWTTRTWLIIFPFALLLSDIGSGIYLLVALSRYTLKQTIFTGNIGIATRLFCVFTVALNIACTGLLSYRIISSQRRVQQTRITKGMSNVVALIIESAVLWTCISLCMVITAACRSYTTFIFMDIAPPTIGIVFASIIIRVSSGSSYGDKSREEREMADSGPIRFNAMASSRRSASSQSKEVSKFTLKTLPTGSNPELDDQNTVAHPPSAQADEFLKGGSIA